MNVSRYLYLSTKATLSVGLFSLLFLGTTQVKANEFIDDASVTGTIFSWVRDREVIKDIDGEYKPNLRHLTFASNLDAKSGYLSDLFALELGVYASWDAINKGYYHPNDVSFSEADTLWDEQHNGDISGVSFYKMQMNFKFNNAWLKAGYIQPSGQTLLQTQKSVVPATYRGAELGTKIDFDSHGDLSASYMWADQYKDPWYRGMYDFRYGKTGSFHKINYLHSLGLKYDFKNHIVLETAFGQAHNYMNQYFVKASYRHDLLNKPLLMNYQFYGAEDQKHAGNKVYDGLAWMQIVSFKYLLGPIVLQTDAKIIQADGNQGYFLKRMTPTLDSSEGRFDEWWDLRSNFNANGERVIFAKISYDLSHLFNPLQGLSTDASIAYGWNAKPSSNSQHDQTVRVKELAWNLGLNYIIQKGALEDTSFKLRYINYNNSSNYANNKSAGFGNLFEDQYEIRFVVTVPFTLFGKTKH